MSDRLLDKFTERAKRHIILACEEARLRHHRYVGTDHLLLGILKDGGGIAIRVLQASGLGIEQIRTEIERHMPRLSVEDSADIEFTPMAKKVLQHAVEEAESMESEVIGSEHLLLGLMVETEGIAYKVLHYLGANVRIIRTKVMQIYNA